jgi:hypothetical protein
MTCDQTTMQGFLCSHAPDVMCSVAAVAVLTGNGRHYTHGMAVKNRLKLVPGFRLSELTDVHLVCAHARAPRCLDSLDSKS